MEESVNEGSQLQEYRRNSGRKKPELRVVVEMEKGVSLKTPSFLPSPQLFSLF